MKKKKKGSSSLPPSLGPLLQSCGQKKIYLCPIVFEGNFFLWFCAKWMTFVAAFRGTKVLNWIYSLQLFLRESTFYVTANHFIFKGDSCRLNKTVIAKSLQQRSSELFEYSANFHGLISKETIFRHKRWLITHFIYFSSFSSVVPHV